MPANNTFRRPTGFCHFWKLAFKSQASVDDGSWPHYKVLLKRRGYSRALICSIAKPQLQLRCYRGKQYARSKNKLSVDSCIQQRVSGNDSFFLSTTRHKLTRKTLSKESYTDMMFAWVCDWVWIIFITLFLCWAWCFLVGVIRSRPDAKHLHILHSTLHNICKYI